VGAVELDELETTRVALAVVVERLPSPQLTAPLTARVLIGVILK
jgi:hypothetical protein